MVSNNTKSQLCIPFDAQSCRFSVCKIKYHLRLVPSNIIFFCLSCFFFFSPPRKNDKKIKLYALSDRGVNFEMDDCRKWVKSKLQEKGCKPPEFVRTVPCYDPSQADVSGDSSGMSLFLLQCSHCKLLIKIYLACCLVMDAREVFGLISCYS